MKKFLLLFIYCIIPFISVNAQKITIDRIDKFTKKRIIQTSFEKICNDNFINADYLTKRVWIAFAKQGEAEFIRLKWCCITPVLIRKDAQILFLDSDGNTYTFKNLEYEISEKGAGTVGYFGSELNGLDIWAYGDISSLEGKNITDMRIYTTDGYVDFKINDQNVITKTYQVYKKGISK